MHSMRRIAVVEKGLVRSAGDADLPPLPPDRAGLLAPERVPRVWHGLPSATSEYHLLLTKVLGKSQGDEPPCQDMQVMRDRFPDHVMESTPLQSMPGRNSSRCHAAEVCEKARSDGDR